MAESFFNNLKSEKIKKRIYKTRQEARSEVFEYIEDFYNPVRRHKHLDQLSPLEFETSNYEECLQNWGNTKSVEQIEAEDEETLAKVYKLMDQSFACPICNVSHGKGSLCDKHPEEALEVQI